MNAPKRIWLGRLSTKSDMLSMTTRDDKDAIEYVRADLIPPASAAPVVEQGPQKTFPPPAEDKLHIAICNAVQSNQFTASDILRQALLDYQPTQLTRSELIRVQQRSGSSEVSAIMVSPVAATAAPVEQSDSLLAKITQIADIGSAEEFGDAIERLRAIRKLIATTNEGAR